MSKLPLRLALILGVWPSLVTAGSPAAWSPDGRWVAYTSRVAPGGLNIPEPGWVLRREGRGIIGQGRDQAEDLSAGVRAGYRLAVVGADRAVSVVLQEGEGVATAPAWKADGRALAFARLVPAGLGRERFEVVMIGGLGKPRVLLARERDGRSSPEEEDRFRGEGLDWSPEGRYLAVPFPPPRRGLTVIRADTGQTLRQEEDGCCPSWSPDGSKLAFVGGGAVPALQLMDATFGPVRPLGSLGRLFQAPAWARDGRTLLVIHARIAQRAAGPTPQVELARVHAESGLVEGVARLSSTPLDRGALLREVSYGVDANGDEMFYAVDADRQPPSVVWYRPRTTETVDRFAPVDLNVRVGSLSLAPAGKSLALRFGINSANGPVGIWETSGHTLQPLVPDDAARVEWLTLLLTSGRAILRNALPPALVGGTEVTRATILPIPGELPPNHDALTRLRRLARLGRPLCDRPAGSPPADPRLDGFLREARLLFSYFADLNGAALAALDELEAHATEPDERLRLLSLRGQLMLGAGDYDRARDVARFLRDEAKRVPLLIEETPAGYALKPEPRAAAGWASYLAQRVEDFAAVNSGEKPDPTLGHRNPDAPESPPLFPLPFDPGLVPPRGVGPVELQPVFEPDDEPLIRPRPPRGR